MLYTATYGNGLFAVVMSSPNGTILTSSDGITWSAQTTEAATYLWGIAYGNGRFVAFGGKGTILTSINGLNWKRQNSGITSYGLLAGAYGKGQFVVWVGDGTVVTSPDGVTWTKLNPGLGTNALSVGVATTVYATGRFVAVCYSPNKPYSPIFTSSDGVAWTQPNSGTTNALWGIAYENGVFVAVGRAGTILQSAPVQPKLKVALLLVGGTVQATVSWLPWESLRIEASTDLTSWMLLTNLTTTSNAIAQFTDPLAARSNRRFYRAASP